MKKIIILVNNKTGLHARPANLFIRAASQFACKIVVEKNGDETAKYNAKSIFSVISMGASKGSVLTIYADGADEDAALCALKELADNDFGESGDSI